MVFMQEEVNLIKNRLRGQKQTHTHTDSYWRQVAYQSTGKELSFQLIKLEQMKGIWNRFLLHSFSKNQFKANQMSNCERKH